MTYRETCPDCGVKVGRLHKRGCDIPKCTICGVQLLQCEEHKNIGNSTWTGIHSIELMLVAELKDLFISPDGPPWIEVPRSAFNKDYDLNRAAVALQKALKIIRDKSIPRKQCPGCTNFINQTHTTCPHCKHSFLVEEGQRWKNLRTDESPK